MQMVSRTSRHSQLGDVSTPHVASGLSEAFVKIADTTVSGGAVTSVQFTGLDLETDGTYYISLYLLSAGAGGANIELQVNGDTTTTNYYNTRAQGSHASIVSTRFNTAGFSYLPDADIMVAHAYITKIASQPPWANCTSGFGDPALADITLWNGTWGHANTTNVTSIEVVSTTASAIANGSRLVLYQVKS